MNSARSNGEHAFQCGMKFEENIYLPHEVEYIEWAEGWLAAEEEWLDR